MKKVISCLAFLLLVICSCDRQDNESGEYPRMIGDIAYNPSIDNPDFQLCKDETQVIQYYALTSAQGLKTYKGENYEISRIFHEQYKADQAKKESGLVRIRFIVNCYGQSGRFRMMSMDNNYQKKIFDASITDQLLSITKSLDGWIPFVVQEIEREYYQYLIFKIQDGNIIEIMP